MGHRYNRREEPEKRSVLPEPQHAPDVDVDVVVDVELQLSFFSFFFLNPPADG